MQRRFLSVTTGLLLLAALAACADPVHIEPHRPAAMGALEYPMFAAPGDTVDLSVIVVDASGRPVPDVGVSWSVVSGGGQVSPQSSTTDDSGLASARWALGTVQDEQVARASASRVEPVLFVVSTAPPGVD